MKNSTFLFCAGFLHLFAGLAFMLVGSDSQLILAQLFGGVAEVGMGAVCLGRFDA